MLSSPTYRALADERSDGVAPAIEPHAVANSVSGISVRPAGDNDWLLDFDYSYTGEPSGAVFRIEVTPLAGSGTGAFINPFKQLYPPQPGVHHVATALDYPGEGTSGQIIVAITTGLPEGKVLATQRIDQTTRWPTQDERDFEIAYDLIDNGSLDAIRQARPILERLVAKNPKFDGAYVELARIAMATNWGPEGLHQAETLLDSARELAPDSANAKILLGYVYAHQTRYEEAEALFVDAARSNPPNRWLWTNWGELLEMRGDADAALAKYREAIRPNKSLHNYRAIEAAYAGLLKLLEARNDIDGMEAAYKQRDADLGQRRCYSGDYARFKLTVRHDAQGAIDLARATLNLNCEDSSSRQVLGLASYMKWAEGGGTESIEALNQARIFLPPGPMTLCLLASSDSTLPAAKKLIAGGEGVDQKDNQLMTALAHALEMDKLDAAERLLRLGASPETPVGLEAMPVALLPVLDGNVHAIRIMQRAGVDYSKLRYRGVTALDIAKQIGDTDLLAALKSEERTL
jgi:tetratricopeptide (TPR) repeat protein